MQSGADNVRCQHRGLPPHAEDPARDAIPSPSPALRRVVYVVSQFPGTVGDLHRPRDPHAGRRWGRRANSDPQAFVRALVQADAAALMDRVRQPSGLAATWVSVERPAGAPARGRAGLPRRSCADSWRRPVVLLKSLATLVRRLGQLPWLREFDPQFIHAHWSTYPTTAAWMLARVMDRPFGFTCHAHDVFVNQQLLSAQDRGRSAGSHDLASQRGLARPPRLGAGPVQTRGSALRCRPAADPLAAGGQDR